MAVSKNFVSPGVFLREIDASFLGPGIGTIGAAIIGTAPKGPAFVPVTVSTYDDFVSFFGDLDLTSSLPYAARAYLKNAGTANFVRVLGPDGRTANGNAVTAGYNAESMWSVTCVSGTSASGTIAALIEVTGSAVLVVTDLGNDQFFLRISSSIGTSPVNTTVDGFVAVTASMLTGSSNYIRKVLNTDATAFYTQGYWLRETYDYAVKGIAGPGGDAVYGSASHAVITNFSFGYNSASSPWIKSQPFGGQEYNLFRIHTIGHGKAENGRYKASVENIRTSAAPSVNEFGRFDLVIRSFGDVDKNKNIVEQYPNLTFDPNDPNYILKVIGDKYFSYDVTRTKMVENNNYTNKSRRIRIEFATASFPPSALPWGFRGLAKADVSFSGSTAQSGINDGSALGNLPLVKDLKDKETQAEAQTYVYWGMETQLSGNVSARFTRMSAMTGTDPDFSLKNVSGSALANLVYNAANSDSVKGPGAIGSTTSNTVLDPSLAKFNIPVAFGSDGWDRRLVDPLDNGSQLASITQLGTQALRQAVEIISDQDFIDINLLAIPGIYAKTVVDNAITAIENRGDAFYIIDVSGSTQTQITQEVQNRGFDSNYAACYYPSIRVNDDINGVAKVLPASVPALGVMAFNDRVSYPWFAPAGLNRGGLSRDTIGFDVLSLVDQLNAQERDILYENRINPIARFPDVPQGVVWGQKTLQLKSSALDRINVRRLLIKAKKLIASAVKFLVFEPNNPATQTRFKQLVNPILADIQRKQGLDTFQVVMDDTTNTPDLIDRNIMAGKIFLVPTRSAEFLSVDFVISKAGTTFSQ